MSIFTKENKYQYVLCCVLQLCSYVPEHSGWWGSYIRSNARSLVFNREWDNKWSNFCGLEWDCILGSYVLSCSVAYGYMYGGSNESLF